MCEQTSHLPPFVNFWQCQEPHGNGNGTMGGGRAFCWGVRLSGAGGGGSPLPVGRRPLVLLERRGRCGRGGGGGGGGGGMWGGEGWDILGIFYSGLFRPMKIMLSTFCLHNNAQQIYSDQ